MRSDKALILAAKEFAKENKAKSWYYTLSTLAILVALFMATFLHINLFVKAIISILTGLVMVRMFIIYHDYQHRTILQKSVPAKVIMWIYGVFVLTPPSIWKRSHDYHHKHNSKIYTASIGSFPISTKEKFLNATPRERFFYLFVRNPLTILFGYIFMFMIGMCLNPFLAHPKRHFDGAIALVLHAIIIALVFLYGGWMALVFTIFIPFFIATAMGSYLFYAQHNFPGATFNIEAWNYTEAALESSSFMVMGPVGNWFTGNIGYHHIHHLNAHIPFYRLPEAMKKIPEFQHPKTTSLNPIEVWRCLRLKLWDPEANKMITLKGIR